MTIKEAILNEMELNNITPRILPNVEFRAQVENFRRFYTNDQLNYLFANGMLEKYEKTGAYWESPYHEYWQFTNKGKRWRIWYTTSLWTLIKVYVLHTHMWQLRWDKLKYKLFGIRVGWMDYSSAYGGEDWDGN